MRTVDYRYQVMRKGVPLVSLSARGMPAIRMQSTAKIMRSMSGSFLQPDMAVDWLTDRLRVGMYLDGAWYDIGTFAVSSLTESYTGGTDVITIQAMDYALLVKQSSTEGILHLAKGTPYISAITTLLASAGIDTVMAADSNDILTTDREDWDEGTSYLDIINQLLAEIAFDPLWFDASGVARLTMHAEPNVSNVKHTYASGKNSIIAADCNIGQDLYSPYNVFKVIVSNADLETPMVATSVNDSVSSPVSVPRLGRRILAPIKKLDNIASQAALQAYADKMRFESQLATETITYTTANTPTHGYADVVALEHERLQGVYQETEWTINCGYNGQMQHKARRILYL